MPCAQPQPADAKRFAPLVCKVGQRLRGLPLRREAGGGGPSGAVHDRGFGPLGLERVDIGFINDPYRHHDQSAREADFDVSVVAGRYTLVDQSALADQLTVCLDDRQIPVIAAGVLSKMVLADPRPGARFH